MQYKFEFIQYDHVPLEHLEMDKQRRMEKGVAEICQAILRDYNYFSKVEQDGKIKYGIELTVTSAEKFHRGVVAITKMLYDHPQLQESILELFKEMHNPDNQFHDRNSL